MFGRVLLCALVVIGLCLDPMTGRADATLADVRIPAPATKSVTSSNPRVLSASDAELYRQIFELGQRSQWNRVDALLGRLNDRLLMGYVLAQRLLHRKTRSRYDDLNAWMAAYADHPDADRIYQLALDRMPRGAAPLRPPVYPIESLSLRGSSREATSAVPSRNLSPKEHRQASQLKRKIRRHVWNGETAAAKRLILSDQARRLLSAEELDDMGTRLGRAYLTDGDDHAALQWAGGAANRSGRYLPQSHWTAGLAAWRLDDMTTAAQHFEALAGGKFGSPWMTSAAAFWAARANLIGYRPDRVNPWLAVAASHPRTFYGLLARHILGLPFPFQWQRSPTEQAAVNAVIGSPAGRRALALIEVGQRSRAEQELSAVASGGPDLARGAIAVSSDAGMTELAVRLDTKLFPDGGGLDLAAYPVPPWQPQSGFTVDRALIYAVIRQESRFNPQAKSSAGARGLMQLMPSTATYVAHNNGYTVRKRSALHEPTINLTLGQRYMEMLLGDANVDGDLFRLATAWNGGPGNLQKWRARIDDRGDPLLFIETIPAGETRNFIERVLANLWIYRDRLGQPSPSLDALAAGGWPAYQPLDRKPLQVASYGEN